VSDPTDTRPPDPSATTVEAGLAAQPRLERVARAVQAWSGDLADLGGAQTLLWHGDLAARTLDLTHTHPSGLAMLLAGRPTRLSSLVREPGALAEARKRARAIRAKTVELAEERGIVAGWLAVGIATWTGPDAARPPSAPVLLRACWLRPRGAAGEDFDVDLGPETELNPVLVHYLATEHDVHLDADLALHEDGFEPTPLLQRVSQGCATVPGFGVEPRLLIGTFSAVRPAMVMDLQAQGTSLAGHDIVAALAGDPGALAAVAAQSAVGAVGEPDPTTERLVLDADSAQGAVVEAVLAGSHLVISGPPGTGKSQTVANLIAALAADGKRTLFVAQKRAAIDAVLQRLASVGLDDLVLDLHDGGFGRRHVANACVAVLDRATRAAQTEVAELGAALVDRRDTLLAHTHALHQQREPWGVTAYAAQSALVDLTDRRPAPRSRVRVRGERLERLDWAELGRLRDQLFEAASAGVLRVGPDEDPWFGARLTTADEAQQALVTVTTLTQAALPAARAQLSAVLDQVGMAPARSVAAWGQTLELIGAVRQSLEVFTPAVFDTSLTDVVAATASRAWRAEHGITMGRLHRRRLRSQARSMLRPGAPPPDLHGALVAAHDQRGRWQQGAGPGSRPALPSALVDAERAYLDLAEPLGWLSERLAETAAGGDLLDTDLDVLAGRLALLGERTATLPLVPRAVALRDRLRQAGLEPLLADLAQRGVEADAVGAELDLVWWSSLLEHVALGDPAYGAHNGSRLHRVALEFAQADRQHVVTGNVRVRHATDERLVAALERHPDQAALLRAEDALSRGHRAPRELLRECPDVLAAAKPCWAMSPLVVSQVLAPGELFDVVIFDEASQVPTAEAVPAISRARQVVVAGDQCQLPPTRFAVSDGSESAGAESAGAESVLAALSVALPVARLRWHYRSQDERLVAFANEHVYDGALVTFPGTLGEEVLTLQQVNGTGPVVPGADAVESTDDEVARVVELVIDHARCRPSQSLGVVTLGRWHAARIDDALRRELAEQPDHLDLAPFFADDHAERFFVKPLERVQGDERDAIVLSIGFGRTPHGRVLHRFGPLDLADGERRLNVAMTRARRRMTVVCSFGADDLDPVRLSTPGAHLLRAYLAYAASGGRAVTRGSVQEGSVQEGSVQDVKRLRGDPPREDPPLEDPLLEDLAARLRAAGLSVRARHGVSSARIDLAVGGADGRLLVAVEGDGPAYARATTRERDRLRVDQLQRLGWMHLRVWSTDVFGDPAHEVARVRAALAVAVRVAVPQEAAPSEAVPQEAVPEQTSDDTDAGWGQVADAARVRDAREQWLLGERPPHWD